jgi:hypothetical protein
MTGALVTLGGIATIFMIVVILDWIDRRQARRSDK